jgi:hypothetical protein
MWQQKYEIWIACFYNQEGRYALKLLNW